LEYLRPTEKQSIMQQKSTNLRRLFLLSFLFAASISFGATSRRHLIYEAYINGNRAQWIQVVNEMEHSTEPKTLSWKLELAEYYYGMVGYYIGMKRNDLAAPILAKGNALIDGVLKEHPGNATALAFKGSLTAFKISLNRYKVMVLGRESLKWMEKSLASDPDNVQALFDRGNAYVHAPAIFGGDPEQGILMYRKAMSLIEKRNQLTDNWLYLHLLVTTADACNRTGHPEKARPYYERALQVEPRFRFVRETLLPALNKIS
jgi:tetratricopeptide (TPR) repeat protein